MSRFVNVSMDAVEEETRSEPMMALPPGYRFRPTGYELCRYYLYDKVTTGRCNWEDLIIDVDILAHQPWDLPGMDLNEYEGYYFYAREKKSKAAGSMKNDRVIKETEPPCCWKMNGSYEVKEQGVLWGKRNALNHCIGSDKRNKTDWLMQEFVLNPSLIAQAGCSNDDDIVLCRVYKKKKDSDSQEAEVKVKGDAADQVISNRNSRRGRKSSKNVAVAVVSLLAISGSGQPNKRKRIDAPSTSTARFPRTTIQESRTQTAPAVASTSSMTPSLFQPPAAAASCSAQPYIRKTHDHPAATGLLVESNCSQSAAASSTFAENPYSWETHSSELAANYYMRSECSFLPLDSADQPYNIIQQTHPAAAAQCSKNDCNQFPAELTGSIQTDDPAAWQQEQDDFCFSADWFLNLLEH